MVLTMAKIAEKIQLSIAIDVYEPMDIFVHFTDLQYKLDHDPKSKYIIKVKREPVPHGADYLINGKAYVQRKEVNDFGKSIIDGRLFNQCRTMNEVADTKDCYLIIEGYLSSISEWSNINPNAVIGAYIALARERVVVLVSRNAEETKRYLERLMYQYASDYESQEPRIRAERPPKKEGLEEMQHYFLAGLPGIQAVRAKKIMEEYKFPGEFLLALNSPEQIEKLNKMFPPKTVAQWSEVIWKIPTQTN